MKQAILFNVKNVTEDELKFTIQLFKQKNKLLGLANIKNIKKLSIGKFISY